jgi:hypothetical protein
MIVPGKLPPEQPLYDTNCARRSLCASHKERLAIPAGPRSERAAEASNSLQDSVRCHQFGSIILVLAAQPRRSQMVCCSWILRGTDEDAWQ